MFSKLLHQFQHLSKTDREYVLAKLKQIDADPKLEATEVLHELFCSADHTLSNASRCMFYEDADEYAAWEQHAKKILDVFDIEDFELCKHMVDCCKAVSPLNAKYRQPRLTAYLSVALLLDFDEAARLLDSFAPPPAEGPRLLTELLPEHS